jgi:hypothetical protein
MGVRRRLRPPGVLSGSLPGACRFEHEPDIRGELPGVEDPVAVWSGVAVLRAGSAEGSGSCSVAADGAEDAGVLRLVHGFGPVERGRPRVVACIHVRAGLEENR